MFSSLSLQNAFSWFGPLVKSYMYIFSTLRLNYILDICKMTAFVVLYMCCKNMPFLNIVTKAANSLFTVGYTRQMGQ